MFTSDFQEISANRAKWSNNDAQACLTDAQEQNWVPVSSTVPIFVRCIYAAIIRDLRLACSFSMSSDKAAEGRIFSLQKVFQNGKQLISAYLIVELRQLTISLPKRFSTKTIKLMKISHKFHQDDWATLSKMAAPVFYTTSAGQQCRILPNEVICVAVLITWYKGNDFIGSQYFG